MTTTKQSCSDCKYYREQYVRYDGVVGHCCRYAPKPSIINFIKGSKTELVWPLVHNSNWCGDFDDYEKLLAETILDDQDGLTKTKES